MPDYIEIILNAINLYNENVNDIICLSYCLILIIVSIVFQKKKHCSLHGLLSKTKLISIINVSKQLDDIDEKEKISQH